MVTSSGLSPPDHVALNAVGLRSTQPDSLAMSSGRQRLAQRSYVASIHARQRGPGTIFIACDGPPTRCAVRVGGGASGMTADYAGTGRRMMLMAWPAPSRG